MIYSTISIDIQSPFIHTRLGGRALIPSMLLLILEHFYKDTFEMWIVYLTA